MSNEDELDLEIYEGDWYCTMNMGIEEVRCFYNHVCYAYETWPGSPRRPQVEQEYLVYLKSKLFAMLMQYQLDNS
jgi:hypothetical protein